MSYPAPIGVPPSQGKLDQHPTMAYAYPPPGQQPYPPLQPAYVAPPPQYMPMQMQQPPGNNNNNNNNGMFHGCLAAMCCCCLLESCF